MWFLMLTLLLAAPAVADPPPPAEELPTIAAYSDKLADINRSLTERVEAATASVGIYQTREASERYFAEIRQLLIEHKAQVGALPTWEGDPALRDAVVADFDWCIALFDDPLTELLDLGHAPRVTNADLARMEELTRSIDAAIESRSRLFESVEADFCKRHDLILLEADAPPAPPAVPSFRTPTIPPAGSVLPGTTHVSFATRYHNHLVALQKDLMDGYNPFAAQTGTQGPAATDARQVAKASLSRIAAEIATLGDWQGDASFRDDTAALAKELAAIVDGPGHEIAVTLREDRMSPANYEIYQRAHHDMNTRCERALSKFRVSQSKFQIRWGMRDFEAWAKTQASASPPPP
jgi:hypothetical protein